MNDKCMFTEGIGVVLTRRYCIISKRGTIIVGYFFLKRYREVKVAVLRLKPDK